MASSSLPNGAQDQADNLLQAQKLLRATLDSSMDMIQVFEAVRNEHGEIVDFTWILNNHASEKIYGDVLGKSLLQVQPGVVEEGIFAAFKHVVETGQPQQYEKHYVHEPFDGWFFQSVVKLGDGVATTTTDITGRKNAEQALQQNKALLQDVIDAPNIGIAVYKALRNKQGQIIDFVHEYINRASLAMLGGEDFTGKLFTDHGQNGIEQLPKLIDVIETGIGNSYLREAHFRGRPVWFAITNSPLDNDRLVHTWEDITQRQKAEQESKEQTHFIQRVTEMMPDVVSVVEFPSRTILYTNRDTMTWVGFDATELGRLSFDERIQLFHPEDLPVIQDFYGRFTSLKDRQETSVEYRLKNKQGDWILLSLRGQVFRRDEQGYPTQLLFVGQNITAQRQAEQDILRLKDEVVQTATDKYRSLFESIDEGFCIVEVILDQNGKPYDLLHLEANAAYERYTGLRGIVGKRSREIIPEAGPWLDFYGNVALTGQAARNESYLVAPVDRWIAASASRIGGEGSLKVAIVFDDITERKRREANQTLLVAIGDDLSQLATPDEIMQAVGQWLGEHLKLGSCVFVDVDEARSEVTVHHGWHQEGVPSLAQQTFRMSDYTTEEFRRASRASELFVVRDTDTDKRVDGQAYARLNVGAWLSVPFHRQGGWQAFLSVTDTAPRDWRDDEIELVRNVADRVFPRIERARAEEAWHASQKRFESIANLVPDLLWESWPDGSTSWFNQRWSVYTGQRLEEAIGWGWTLAIHPDDREISAREYRQAVEAGQSLQQEHRIRRHDGVYRWFVVSTSPLKDPTGQVVKMYGAATDIHESKQAEQALRRLEERTRLALEAAQLATWEWDLVQDQVYWNQQHFHLFGMPVGVNPLPAQAFLSHLHPDDAPFIQAQLTQAIAQRTLYDAEFRIVRQDGVVRWMSGYGRVVAEQDAHPVLASGVMFDITDRKQAEEAMKQADQRKDEFLAMLAHELRNPMSTIRSGMQILNITDGKDQMSSETIAMMNRQTEHLVRMVDDLLDVSRISRGKIELHRERLNLVEVVRQAAESVHSLYREQGKRLELELPSAPLYVDGDATRLTQVVANLLTNGARYTGDQGQVWVSLTQKDKQAILQVQDNGIGLTADQLTAIFELFVQVDNSTARSKGGLGLGLTLVRRIVELHGGQVDARSEGLGKGSAFTVYLPTLATAASPQSQPAPQATASAGRILVIDDNADAAFTLVTLLKLKGYEAHARHSGLAGIEAAQQLQPAAILLDIGMPGMDGYETCRALREQAWNQALIVIALTGYGQEEDRQRAKQASFDGHLIKPVDQAVLLNLLTELLEKGKQR